MKLRVVRQALVSNWLLFILACFLTWDAPARAQYVGVTCGWNYGGELTGPNVGDFINTPLFNPNPSKPNLSWIDWVEELRASGVDFVCPNLRGNMAPYSPTNLTPLLQALQTCGMSSRIKIANFDDNASSWVAYGTGRPFDMANTNNWKYIWDQNYKPFYETIPDTNRFKLHGRPVIIVWTGNNYFFTNMQGNASKAFKYVRQQCQSTFGFNPFIIVSADFLTSDTTMNDTNVVDAIESWFTPNSSHGNSWTLRTYNGVKIGALCPQYQDPIEFPNTWLDPAHGNLLANSLMGTRGSGALLTLIEGFTDWYEDAMLCRSRNLDENGNPLSYAQTYYDYPNQRINITRRYGNSPFPVLLQLEAEACDNFGGGSAKPGFPNYYRNGNINIETTTDSGSGWNVTGINAGQWLEWLEVPIQGSKVHLRARVASPNAGCKLHFVIDGVAYPSMTVPVTGDWQAWTTIDSEVAYAFPKGSTHTVKIVCETSGFNLNYLQIRDEIPLGATISLQSRSNNKWVTASNNGTSPLIASSVTFGTSESFTLVDASSTHGYGYVALNSLANGNYVTADTNGALPLIANATSVGETQVFEWIDNGDGSIALRAFANNMAVTAGSLPLVANRLNAGASEAFNCVVSGEPQAIATPTGLAVAPGSLQNILSWNESFGAKAYNLKRSITTGGPYTMIVSNTSLTTYVDSGLIAGTTYYYVVCAAKDMDQSAYSSEASGTPHPAAQPKVYWTGDADGNWMVGGNWSNGIVSANAIVYDTHATKNFAQTLGQDWTVNGIVLSNPGGNISLNAGNTLMNLAGIDMSSSTRALTLNAAQELLASQSWIVSGSGVLTNFGAINMNGFALTISNSANVYQSGAIGGIGQLIKTGSGTVNWGSQGNYTGGTFINGGTLKSLSAINGLGAKWSPVYISSNATWSVNGITAFVGNLTLSNGFCGISRSGNIIYSNVISHGASTIGVSEFRMGSVSGNPTGAFNVVDGTLTVYVNQLRDENGIGNLIKTGLGTMVVTNVGTSYKGSTTIARGTLQVSKLTNGGTDSHIGQSSSAATNLVLNGGTLKYAGAAATSDRLFSLGKNGGTLEASGSGALTLNNPGSVGFIDAGTHTLILSGTSTAANTLGASLGEKGGVTDLIKSGAGGWTLNNTNSFSGGTTVSGGTLTVSPTATLGSGNLTVSSGATCVLQNDNAMSAGAYVYLNGILNLANSGTNTVSRLYIGGILQPAGKWNAARNSARFSGGGTLNVTEGSAAGPIVLNGSVVLGNVMKLIWTNSATDLYYTLSLTPPVVWLPVTNKPIISSNQWTVTLPGSTNGSIFYRLQQ